MERTVLTLTAIIRKLEPRTGLQRNLNHAASDDEWWWFKKK
jgi:hypothetical protein